jgi:hypothetical protein
LVRIPGIPHRRAVKALEKAGFHVVREGKHIVMKMASAFSLSLALIRLTLTRWAESFVTLA